VDKLHEGPPNPPQMHFRRAGTGDIVLRIESADAGHGVWVL